MFKVVNDGSEPISTDAALSANVRCLGPDQKHDQSNVVLPRVCGTRFFYDSGTGVFVRGRVEVPVSGGD